MRWSIALLAVLSMLSMLSMTGCGTRAGVGQASGDYDMGQACYNQGGLCYPGTVESLCVQKGPGGCDQDPTAPNALFCCIQFPPDASLYGPEAGD